MQGPTAGVNGADSFRVYAGRAWPTRAGSMDPPTTDPPMKTTIRIIAAAAMLAAVSTPAFAQGGGGGGQQMTPQERQARMNAMMFEGITLSDVQKAKIDSIQAASAKAQQEARAAGGGDRQGMMAKMQEIQTRQREEIKKVLTAEQVTKYEENLAKMPQGRGRGRGGSL